MFAHMAWAMKLPIKDPHAKWLLVTLCDFTNQDGKCWPSQSLLQERTALSKATINRRLKSLEEDGYIVRVSGHTGHNTEYFVQCEMVSHRDLVVSDRDTKQSLTRNITRKRGSKISEDFKPSEKTVNRINKFASEQGATINHDYETDKFCDFHIAKGSIYKDHQAAYRNWCRNAIKFSAERRASSANRGGVTRQGDTLSDRFGDFVNSIDS